MESFEEHEAKSSLGDCCEICGGTGEVYVDVDDGEGHIMKGVGVEQCDCQLVEEFEE